MIMITLLVFVSTEAKSEKIALVAKYLVDGKSDRIQTGKAVLVKGNRIVKIVSQNNLPKGYWIIDLGDATLLPGLIDAHCHPLISTDDYQLDHIRDSSAAKALRGLKAVQGLLNAGWTTIRIAGDADVHYAHLEIGKAIDKGLFDGPRIMGAGHYISITGGGGDINFIAPEHQIQADGLIVDGVAAMRKAVRTEVKHGSTWIKILVTGAFMSAGDNPKNIHISPEELKIAVQESARLGVPVMAHAHATAGIIQAVNAGVRSIEHGTFIDAKGIRLMKAKGTYLVPTIYIGDYYLSDKAESVAQKKMNDLTRKYRKDYKSRIRRAIKAGVKVVIGTDLGGYDKPEINVREFASMIELGMTPMQSIKAGTSLNAKLLGLDKNLGTIEAGKLADIVAVPGNLLKDISRLEKITFVMKDGAVIRPL
jgi:imidazolonepropionase-like amidohydrolase